MKARIPIRLPAGCMVLIGRRTADYNYRPGCRPGWWGSRSICRRGTYPPVAGCSAGCCACNQNFIETHSFKRTVTRGVLFVIFILHELTPQGMGPWYSLQSISYLPSSSRKYWNLKVVPRGLRFRRSIWTRRIWFPGTSDPGSDPYGCLVMWDLIPKGVRKCGIWSLGMPNNLGFNPHGWRTTWDLFLWGLRGPYWFEKPAKRRQKGLLSILKDICNFDVQ